VILKLETLEHCNTILTQKNYVQVNIWWALCSSYVLLVPTGRKHVQLVSENEINYEQLYKKPLPLTLSKWQDLQKLKKFLPPDTHSFYDSLEHSSFKPRLGSLKFALFLFLFFLKNVNVNQRLVVNFLF